MSDHYARLGLTKSATQEQIKQAFREKALRYHPDSGGRDSDRHEFMRIKEAYDVLKDPASKAAYDRSLEFQQSAPRPRQTAQPAGGQSGTSFQSARSKARTAAQKVEDIRKLNRLMSQRRLGEVESMAEAMIRRDPQEHLAYAALADIARLRGDYARAAEYFGYAAQFSNDETYVDRHLEMSKLASRPAARMRRQPRKTDATPVLVGVFAVMLMMLYVANSREPAAFQQLPIISEYSFGLVAMLAMAGITIGAVLVVSNAVEGIDAGRMGANVLPPVLAIGLFALVNFWFATLVFAGLSAYYRIANPSLTRFLVACSCATLAFSLSAYVRDGLLAMQVLLWGGTIIAWGGIIGWLAANSFRNLEQT